ncbi:MAG TPA: hypothetical protein VGP45_00805, partial [Marinobacter sp.]|nr:hypothetical protein [Marinobacter sp.]
LQQLPEMIESRYLPLFNTKAYHQMALGVWIGLTRETFIIARYSFLVSACIIKTPTACGKPLQTVFELAIILAIVMFYVVLSTMPFIGYLADLSFYTQPSGCVFFWGCMAV